MVWCLRRHGRQVSSVRTMANKFALFICTRNYRTRTDRPTTDSMISPRPRPPVLLPPATPILVLLLHPSNVRNISPHILQSAVVLVLLSSPLVVLVLCLYISNHRLVRHRRRPVTVALSRGGGGEPTSRNSSSLVCTEHPIFGGFRSLSLASSIISYTSYLVCLSRCRSRRRRLLCRSHCSCCCCCLSSSLAMPSHSIPSPNSSHLPPGSQFNAREYYYMANRATGRPQ